MCFVALVIKNVGMLKQWFLLRIVLLKKRSVKGIIFITFCLQITHIHIYTYNTFLNICIKQLKLIYMTIKLTI